MKRFLIILTLTLLPLAASAQLDTIRVSTLATTHIRFASDLKYVDISNKVIAAKIVEGSKDILALKAREAFDFVTTVSCLEANGSMHSFFVAYSPAPARLVFDTRRKAAPGADARPPVGRSDAARSAGRAEASAREIAAGDAKVADFPFSSNTSLSSDAATLDSLMNMPKRLYHIGAKDYGISLYCDNIFVVDDIMYLVFSIDNRSAVSYAWSEPRFAIESKKRSKRKLVYEKQIFPRVYSGANSVAPSTQGRTIYAFDKTTLLKGQVFRACFYESGGSRNFVLSFDVQDVNRAEGP